MSSQTKYTDIKRKNSDTSFVEKVADFSINQKWNSGYRDIEAGNRTHLSYFWNALSAVGNEIGEEVTQNVMNYIDCASNIDTCKITSLKSMCQEYGIDYTILNFVDIPVEVLKLMDIMSMNKTYLLDSKFSQLMEYSRLSVARDSQYEFDYYNAEFFNGDYVNGNIIISLSAATIYQNEDPYNCYFLFEDHNPDSYEKRLRDYYASEEYKTELYDDSELSAYRVRPPWLKMFVTDDKFKLYPTWLSDYTSEFITLDDEIEEVSGFYKLFIDGNMRLGETNFSYPPVSIEALKVIEDEYEFVGHLSVVIRREDDVSDKIRLNKVYKGKSTGNNLYYVEFIPTRTSTLTEYRKYTYNDSVYFWLVLDPKNERMLASSNSRLDCTSKRCTFYTPMLYSDDMQYCYNGIRISPDEFVSDVFLDSSIYFMNLRKENGKWKYNLMQQENMNLYKIGVMNVCTRFIPEKEVVRNIETSVNGGSYHQCLENIFYDLLSTMCNMEYLEPSYSEKKIYRHIGKGGNLSLPALMNGGKNKSEDIVYMKNQLMVSLKFNECQALDYIESGISSMNDYSESEQKIIDIEVNRRAKAQNVVYNQTRYYYYREAKVREYFRYIQQMYNDKYIVGNTIYKVDKRYFVVDDNINDLSSLITESTNDGIYTIEINDSMMRQVAYILADIAISISKIRDELKQTSQKYYMRGTSELLFYTINNYLNKNIKNEYDELSDFVGKYADIRAIEYIDNTEYFNISQNLEEYKNIKYGETSNNRYFENTLIEQLYLRHYGNKNDYRRSMSLGYDEISTFYKDVHDLGFNTDEDLQEFLDTVYNTGATYSHINADLNEIEHSSDLENGVVVEDKESVLDTMYKNYSGNELGVDPLYNHKNRAFSSYQIHPFMYNFVEYLDQMFPIENYYHKYIPEDYNQLVATQINDMVGVYGQVINQWKTDSFDFTGYSSRFEIEANKSETNPNTMSDFQDRDGMFLDEFIMNQFFRTGASTGLSAENGNELETVVNDSSLQESYLSSFTEQLKMSKYEMLLESKRFQYYAVIIEDIVKTNPDYYDIYKYTEDVNGNLLFLLKKYSVPVMQATEYEKRNTRGTLWIRQKNHPCAFPAFNVDTNYFQKNGKLKHKIYKDNSDYDIILDQINSFYYHDNKDLLNSEIFTNFMGGFYDMELDSTNQYLMLSYTPQDIQNYENVHTAKNVNVMIGRLSKEYDYTNVLYRYGFDADSSGVTKIQNRNLREKLDDYVYNEFVGFLRYGDSIGACFVQKNVNSDTKEDTLKEIIDWKTSIIKVNNDFADYEVKYGMTILVDLFDYTKNIIHYERSVSDIKYNINPDNNICMSYTDDMITIGFESEEIKRNSLVTNYAEYCNSRIFDMYDGLLSAIHLSGSLSVDQEISSFYLQNDTLSSEFLRNLDGARMSKHSLVVWPYVATDFNLKGGGTVNTSLVNSFDAFDKYIITIDFRFSGDTIVNYETKYYNLNSDMSFSSVLPNEGGIQRMWNNRNLCGLSSVNMEILGYSSDYYIKEDESKFYEGQNLLAQERALRMLNDDNNQRSIVLENPFPYKSTVSADETHKVVTEFPFDLYDQLEVRSMDDGISAELVLDDVSSYIQLHALSSGVDLSSTNIVISRKVIDKDLGPMFYPGNEGEFTEYTKVDYIEVPGKQYDGLTSITQMVTDLDNHKGFVEGGYIRSRNSQDFYFNDKLISSGDLSVIMTQFQATTPNARIRYVSPSEIYVDGEQRINIGEFNKMVSPIPFTYITPPSPSLTAESDPISTVVTILSGQYYYDGIAGEPISSIIQEGDEVEFQQVHTSRRAGKLEYEYAINPNQKIDEPDIRNVFFKRDTHVPQFFITKEDNIYYGTTNLDNGKREYFDDTEGILKYRKTNILGYVTWFENGKQVNYISQSGIQYKYPASYVGSFRNGIYLDKNRKYMICTNGGIAVGTDGISWKEYPTEQIPNQVLSGGGYDFIVKGSGSLLYSADYNRIFTYDAKFSTIKFTLKSNPQIFKINLKDYGISSYTFGLYNSYNNVILYKYNSETGEHVNTYSYVGNFDEDYRWNSGQIGLSSFSIDYLSSIGVQVSDECLSVCLNYIDGTKTVNSSTMYAYVKANDRNTKNYDKYHVFQLNPTTTEKLRRNLEDVTERTDLSSIPPFNREFTWKDPDLAFKYPAQAIIKDRNGFPKNE